MAAKGVRGDVCPTCGQPMEAGRSGGMYRVPPDRDTTAVADTELTAYYEARAPYEDLCFLATALEHAGQYPDLADQVHAVCVEVASGIMTRHAAQTAYKGFCAEWRRLELAREDGFSVCQSA